jgi:hypothetical protein
LPILFEFLSSFMNNFFLSSPNSLIFSVNQGPIVWDIYTNS